MDRIDAIHWARAIDADFRRRIDVLTSRKPGLIAHWGRMLLGQAEFVQTSSNGAYFRWNGSSASHELDHVASHVNSELIATTPGQAQLLLANTLYGAQSRLIEGVSVSAPAIGDLETGTNELWELLDELVNHGHAYRINPNKWSLDAAEPDLLYSLRA